MTRTLGKLIGIVGYMGAGKTSLVNEAIMTVAPVGNSIRISFSDPIYDMMRALGVSDAILQDKARWHEPLEILCGRSARYAAQTLGTEWGRDTIGASLWTDIALARALEHRRAGLHVIIDNVRFPTEFTAMCDLGAKMIAVTRYGTSATDHASEQHIASLQTHCDFSIANDGTFMDGVRSMHTALDRIISAG